MNRSLVLVAVLMFATVNCQLRDNNEELYTHSCIPGGPSPTIFASFNPCYDTPGCKLPYCCGNIARFTNFSMIYLAKKDVQGGTMTGFLTGVTLTTPVDDPLKFPVPVIFPPILAEQVLKFYPDICSVNGVPRTDNFCPQKKDNVYTYKGTGEWPPVLNTATVILEVQIILHEGNTEILCFKFYCRIVDPDLLSFLPSLLNLGPLLG